MKKTVLYFVSLLCAITSCGTHDVQTSPNQKLTLNHVETDSTNEFTLNYRTDDGKDVVVMNIPMIGITTENGRGTNLEYKKVKGGHRHIGEARYAVHYFVQCAVTAAGVNTVFFPRLSSLPG